MKIPMESIQQFLRKSHFIFQKLENQKLDFIKSRIFKIKNSECSYLSQFSIDWEDFFCKILEKLSSIKIQFFISSSKLKFPTRGIFSRIKLLINILQIHSFNPITLLSNTAISMARIFLIWLKLIFFKSFFK